MELTYYPYTIKLKDRFTISNSSRLTTPAIMVEIAHDGFVGYGEASLPPYLVENQASVIDFLYKIDLSQFNDPLKLDSILEYINQIDSHNYAAKAALDIALNDLVGKLLNIPVYEYLKINLKENLYTSFTIGISGREELKKKIIEASQFKFLKVKLGSENDKEIVENIRSVTDVPLIVDVNQGWKDKHFGLDMINWLSEQNVLLVEQPLQKEDNNSSKWLTEKSPLPIIADEAVQRIDDLNKIKDCYSGINIKLMKAGGINHAHQMIKKAKEIGLKILLGCMTETSCAITAASHLSPLVDWIDLDGAELIANDPFSGMKIIEGRLLIPYLPGLGVQKIDITAE